MRITCRIMLRLSRILAVTSMVLLTVGSLAFGQNAFDTGTPAESKGGTALLSSFAQDKIETVNLANGNLNVHIPLVTIGGRGSASLTLALCNNSKLWTGEQAFNNLDQITVGGATYDDLLMRMGNVIAIGSGWFILRAPAIKARKVEIDWLRRTVCNGQANGPEKVLTKVWLVLPDGSEIEMRDRATQGEPHSTSVNPNCTPNNNDLDRGRIWYSTDGSAITYVTDADNGVVTNQFAGYVFFPDGTRMRMRQGGSCADIIDSNGNYVHVNYNAPGDGAVTYTDQLGREVILEPLPGGATTGAKVTIKGYNSMPDRIIQVDAALLGAPDGSGTLVNLRSDYRSVQLPIFNGDFEQGSHAFPGPHTDLFSQSDVNFFMQSSVDQQPVVTRLNLLDGRKFQFRYNTFGELAEIVYPGGGISQIDYTAFGASLCDAGGLIRPQLNRRVTQRRMYSDGTTLDGTWTYSRDTATVQGVQYPRVTLEAHQGSQSGPLLMSEKHYFLNLDKQYLNCTLTRGNHGTGFEFWDNAKEFRVERTTGGGSEIVKRSWEQRTPVLWGGSPAPEQPPSDPRVFQEDTILENGKMRRVVSEYDGGERITNAFNNVTRVHEYAFGTDGNPGPLARETLRTYATVLNGNCYVNLAGTNGDCPPDNIPGNLGRVIHKRHLLTSQTVKDGNGAVEAYSEIEYDNYATDANHAPITTNTGMIQYDGTWFDPFLPQNQPRGNVTLAKGLISGPVSGGVYTTAYSQYDQAGNVVKIIDPLAHSTTVSYADNFGDGSNPDNIGSAPNGATFALPTLVTNALNQQAKTQYDYTRGIASGVKDANGTIAKSEFDVYDRPVRVTAAYASTPTADTAITEMSYPSASANESRVSRQLDSTRWLSSRAQYDGFGRTILASQAEDGAHFNSASFTIHSKTLYDGLGRAVKGTNPYRSGSNATDGWTRTAFDIAGRVIDVATFSGSPATPPPDYPAITGTGVSWTGSVATAYDSDQTTVTDQAGKKRRSTVNSLGQLVQVDELNDGGSLYAATNYSYDARGNLLTTTQAAGATTQTRRFAYDFLSRLIFAANPEQNTSSNSLFTYNSQQWAVRYVYDAASNLTDKTDTRPVGAGFVNNHYDYDVLNRVFQRSYNDGTPQVNYVYDTATNGVGRLRSVTASGVSTYNYTVYDALGRPTAYNQATEGQTYSMSCTYNKAGMMVDETYPSGKVMHTEYDSAGRPAGVKKTTNAFYYAGAAATDATNRVQYAAHGAMSVMKLGNGLWEHGNFNSLLQPTQIGLGSGQTSSSVVGLDYTYGVLVSGSLDATKNNGNIQSQSITVPGETFVQSYFYDQVNRLASVEETFNAKLIWTQSYGFDRWGNRTSLINSGSKAAFLPTQSTPPVDSATNRLLVPLYDAAGNMILATPSNYPLYAYDAENRMTMWRDTTVLAFSYDGDGRRVEKTNQQSGEIIVFVYNSAGQMVAEYTSFQGAPMPNLKVSYLTADHLSSTRVVTNEAGAVVARHDYMPYGEEIPALVARTGIAGYGAADGIRQKFTQKERDSESGLDYFLARYYSSAQGRFTSADPLLASATVYDPQTWNRYSYTLNNPLKYVDPFGLYVYAAGTTDEQKKKFEQGLKNLANARDSFKKGSAEYKRLDRAFTAFGAKGVANGVTIAFGATKDGAPAHTSPGIKADPTTGAKLTTGDNPSGQDTRVTIDPTQTKSAHDYVSAVGHEGSHVADISEFAAALPTDLTTAAAQAVLNGPLHLTKYVTETRAYEADSFIAQGRGAGTVTVGPGKYEIWNSGWREADRASKRTAGIDKVLARPKSQGGLYEVTPTNQGKKFLE